MCPVAGVERVRGEMAPSRRSPLVALYLVSYDVAADKRRTRVAQALEDHGVRVQFSVFEVETGERGLDKLLGRLTDLIDPTTDSIRAYPLCLRCRGSVTVVGKGPAAGEREDVVVV
jgi:CRISPR-associated protein Cas2